MRIVSDNHPIQQIISSTLKKKTPFPTGNLRAHPGKPKLKFAIERGKDMHKRIAGLLVLILIFICTASFAENSITAGDKVTFGKYPQHMKSGVPADPEPISWLVLDVDGDKGIRKTVIGCVGDICYGCPYERGSCPAVAGFCHNY